ncbi:DUF4148 domain-containing protein [Paraburkholderia sp.]|uniref:DUF4148 domain-containing protein n=1 Tax=Paraburkholderia sp. TaxID=1926495 RepID=UPI002390E210|nr:DUF4148 domain-containing protein [Paraburkholderia sp.]MDE1181834.1 DUF4148 domain-containing protein [Paraburkholderia sp.]
MKSLVFAALVGSVLMVPSVSFAQQSGTGVTRAQVKAELAELASVGYHVGDDDVHYPEAIQAAQEKLAARRAAAYGSGAAGSAEAGTRAITHD